MSDSLKYIAHIGGPAVDYFLNRLADGQILPRYEFPVLASLCMALLKRGLFLPEPGHVSQLEQKLQQEQSQDRGWASLPLGLDTTGVSSLVKITASLWLRLLKEGTGQKLGAERISLVRFLEDPLGETNPFPNEVRFFGEDQISRGGWK